VAVGGESSDRIIGLNSAERLRNRLQGKHVDRVPNFDIVMSLGAHLIGKPLSRYYLDYRILVEANLAVREKFELDILQVISDPYREAADYGLEVEFPEDGLPLRKRPLLTEPAAFLRLQKPDPVCGARMSDRIEAVRLLRERAGADVPVMGWVEGALAEANVLRGDTALMLDLYDRPEWVRELLDFCVDLQIEFARRQVEAGADIIGLGDAIASQISPAMYEEFALPYERRIFSAVHEMGALARLHICGNTSRILEPMGKSGADIVDLDWMVDLATAARTYGEGAPAVCGNFDPVGVMLRGSTSQVRLAVARCLQDGGSRCISAAGCEIPDGTPHPNLFAQRDALAGV
jgi:MtaA/CmuA family methyltransferase